MGTMRKSTLAGAFIGLIALAVPTAGQAADTTYTPRWPGVHQGGDNYNNISKNQDTGEARIGRLNIGLPSGGLGCLGKGGFVEFEQSTLSHADPISSVTLSYKDAALTAFSFIKLSVRKGGEGLQASVIRGPLQGEGTVTIDLENVDGDPISVEGPLDIWFGLEVSSACPPTPPLELAQATFTSLKVS